jgi:hypothetical protein
VHTEIELTRATDPEANMEGVERHGLDRQEMAALLTEAGFVHVRIDDLFNEEKDTEQGRLAFPYIVCLGQRASG